MVQGGGLAEAVEVTDLVKTVKLNRLRAFDPLTSSFTTSLLVLSNTPMKTSCFFVILCPRNVRLIKSRSIENQVETNLHLYERLANVLI